SDAAQSQLCVSWCRPPCRWTAASALRGGGRVGQPSAIFHDDRSATAAKQPGQPARLTSPLLLSNGHGLVVDWGRCPPLRGQQRTRVPPRPRAGIGREFGENRLHVGACAKTCCRRYALATPSR